MSKLKPIDFHSLEEHMFENMYWHKDGEWLLCDSSIYWQGDDENQEFRIGRTQESNQYALVVPYIVKSVLSVGHILSDSIEFLIESAHRLEVEANKQVKLTMEISANAYRLQLARINDQVWELIRKHCDAAQGDRYAIHHKFKKLLDARESILKEMKGKK